MKKYIQVLSVVASIAVVMMHTNGIFWEFAYEGYWVWSNLLECLVYFAVPTFFMISGCNLIDYRKKYSTKIFFVNRIKKTVIPFLIWSVIACVYLLAIGYIMPDSLTVQNVINAIFNAQYVSVYWFFMPLFGVYLCIPPLAMIPDENKKDIFKYLIVASFIFNIAAPFIFTMLDLAYNWNLSVEMAGGCLFFVLVGYYIDHYELTKRIKILIYLSGFAGFCTHFAGTWFLSFRDGALNETFKGYLTLPCVLYAVAVFLFFKDLNHTKLMSFLAKGFSFFSDATFGVYLTHWFIINIWLRHVATDRTTVLYRFWGGIAIFIVAAFLVKLIKKIPFIRNIVP